jgi:plasmid replication initiation protein
VASKNPARFSTARLRRSKNSLPLYRWAKKHAAAGTKRITLEAIRKILGVESVKDATGKVIWEAPLSYWGNFRQRALNTAIAEINSKSDLHVEIESLERIGIRVTGLNFTIKTQAIPKKQRARSRATVNATHPITVHEQWLSRRGRIRRPGQRVLLRS